MLQNHASVEAGAHVAGRGERRDGIQRVADQQDGVVRLGREVAVVPLLGRVRPLGALHVQVRDAVARELAVGQEPVDVGAQLVDLGGAREGVAAADARQRVGADGGGRAVGRDERVVLERLEVARQQIVEGRGEGGPLRRVVEDAEDDHLDDGVVEQEAGEGDRLVLEPVEQVVQLRLERGGRGVVARQRAAAGRVGALLDESTEELVRITDAFLLAVSRD